MSQAAKLLVVDDKQMMRDSVAATLQRAGYQVVTASDGDSALKLIARHRPAAVITDLKMPEMDGLELLSRIRSADDQLPVVLMTAYGTVDAAVQAMKNGAFDFIQKPFEGQQLVMTMRRAVEFKQLINDNAALKSSNQGMTGNEPVLVGRSAPMRALAGQIQKIAHSHGTVLVCGESGTGKEVVARLIHAHSPRRDRPMLAMNCAAISGSLLESELFGHEKGAFTGADQLRKGRFELADGGTLLLDEISEIDTSLQAKLLRVLQEQNFERVGSSMTMSVDVRVIATTNRRLADCVNGGTFRQDLYYRLNVLPIQIPPLRDRLEDVPLLAEHFLTRVAMREGREPKRFDEDAVRILQDYQWPGNVRELQNICERASVLSRHHMIKGSMIRPWLTAGFTESIHPASQTPAPASSHMNGFVNGAAQYGQPGNVPQTSPMQPSYASTGDDGELPTLEEVEREQILRTLSAFHGNRKKTAESLGIGVRTLGLKLKKWKELNLVAESV